jgi:medium-chain acyl-[acyl-carrier-protein] hydrolase
VDVRGISETGRWVRRWTKRPDAAVRLLCFPWAGGAAAAFRSWAAGLPPSVDVCAVEYPGRAGREEEAPLETVAALARGCAPEVGALLDRPFGVLGYSLGALVAYEWLRALQAAGGPAPLHLLVCARRAPHLVGGHPPLHLLEDAALADTVGRRFGAIPDLLLREPELLGRFLAPLRADLRAVETYAYAPGPPLRAPLTALGGTRDDDVGAGDLVAWDRHTAGPFHAEQVEAGHFFLESPRLRDALLERLVP